MSDEAPINAVIRRADELLAAHQAKADKGGGVLPENPYGLLREVRDWLWKDACSRSRWHGGFEMSYEEDIRASEQARKQAKTEIDRLRAEVAAWQKAERDLNHNYLHLRTLLADWGAFDTPHAPTGPQVWATTETALRKLKAELAAKDARIAGGERWFDLWTKASADCAALRKEPAEAQATSLADRKRAVDIGNALQTSLGLANKELAEAKAAMDKERAGHSKLIDDWLQRGAALEAAKACHKSALDDCVRLRARAERAEAHYGDAVLAWKEWKGVAERAEAECKALQEASDRIGRWLSVALDDPYVCDAMKTDIHAWFAVLNPSPAGGVNA